MKRDLDPGTRVNKGLSFGRGCIIPWCYSVGLVRPIWDVCFSVGGGGGETDGLLSCYVRACAHPRPGS